MRAPEHQRQLGGLAGLQGQAPDDEPLLRPGDRGTQPRDEHRDEGDERDAEQPRARDPPAADRHPSREHEHHAAHRAVDELVGEHAVGAPGPGERVDRRRREHHHEPEAREDHGEPDDEVVRRQWPAQRRGHRPPGRDHVGGDRARPAGTRSPARSRHTRSLAPSRSPKRDLRDSRIVSPQHGPPLSIPEVDCTDSRSPLHAWPTWTTAEGTGAVDHGSRPIDEEDASGSLEGGASGGEDRCVEGFWRRSAGE